MPRPSHRARPTNGRPTNGRPTNGRPTNGRPARVDNGKKSLLKEHAYQAIKQRLLRGEFSEDSFLAERQLAHQLGMSKTPVRSALERLQAEGFVTISPQQGILVRTPTIDEVADQYEIRTALETYVVRSLAGRLTSAQQQTLEANMAGQAQLTEDSSPADAVRMDAEFHILFCRFLNNQEILHVMERLRERMQRIITAVFSLSSTRMRSSVQEHQAIAQAVLRGDAQLAAKLMEEHLEYGKQCLLSRRRFS